MCYPRLLLLLASITNTLFPMIFLVCSTLKLSVKLCKSMMHPATLWNPSKTSAVQMPPAVIKTRAVTHGAIRQPPISARFLLSSPPPPGWSVCLGYVFIIYVAASNKSLVGGYYQESLCFHLGKMPLYALNQYIGTALNTSRLSCFCPASFTMICTTHVGLLKHFCREVTTTKMKQIVKYVTFKSV